MCVWGGRQEWGSEGAGKGREHKAAEADTGRRAKEGLLSLLLLQRGEHS